MASPAPSDLEHLRHSLAHLLAAAVMELYPDTHRTIGPSIDDGFYFDFAFKRPLSADELPKIEKKMRQLLPSWSAFTRHELTAQEAKAEYPGNAYKHELIDEFSEGGTKKVSFYKSGKYWDLCRGGHVEDMKQVPVDCFKLDRLAGAYWKGSEKNAMLTRIYGLAFATKVDLDAHLALRAEAERRDHRKLGAELELFTFDDLCGKGMPLWLPNGTLLRDLVETLAKREETRAGYVRVATPHLGKEALFTTSGHLPYYKDSMYPPMVMDDGTYYLKAMNCPHHHLIYRSKMRSYRELPIRMAEYGTVYRNELSGTLAGLLRVRMLSMNDAHIYCRADQIEAEFASVMKLVLRYFKLFGLKDYWFRLSKWDPKETKKYINEPENWTNAEAVLRKVLKDMKVKFVEAENEAAFYGPKVDVQFRSAIGREETMSTIQLDFAAKKRFGLTYMNAAGVKDENVFVIHRAPLSTHERFIAFLIEHYAGAFPTWLAPVQVAVIPIAKSHARPAEKLAKMLRSEGIRVVCEDAKNSLRANIRKSEKAKVPYMIVIGDKEKALRSLAVRIHGKKAVKMMTPKILLARLAKENTVLTGK